MMSELASNSINYCYEYYRNTDFTPEELLGMLFNHSRELAQDYAGKTHICAMVKLLCLFLGTNIRDVIITIPAFFNQAQRRAVIRSVSLSCNHSLYVCQQ